MRCMSEIAEEGKGWLLVVVSCWLSVIYVTAVPTNKQICCIPLGEVVSGTCHSVLAPTTVGTRERQGIENGCLPRQLNIVKARNVSCLFPDQPYSAPWYYYASSTPWANLKPFAQYWIVEPVSTPQYCMQQGCRLILSSNTVDHPHNNPTSSTLQVNDGRKLPPDSTLHTRLNEMRRDLHRPGLLGH